MRPKTSAGRWRLSLSAANAAKNFCRPLAAESFGRECGQILLLAAGG
jgi:hypothetical protein